MGLTAILENERGEALEQVEDPTNVLHRFLPSRDDGTSRCLAFIDRYGDTVFNRLQARPFLAEWERLIATARRLEERAVLSGIQRLGEQLVKEPHLYLRFRGG